MIRKAIPNDLDAVAEIYVHIHMQERLKNICVGWIPDVYPTRATAEKALERGDLFVYQENDKILAAAIINREQVAVYADCVWEYEASADEIMVIHTLVVEPAAGKKGIGKQFIAFYEDYAHKEKCRVLRLDTNAKNVTARKFYANLGYREAGIRSCEFNGIPDVPLVLLEKAL